jgi:hypothetical protein
MAQAKPRSDVKLGKRPSFVRKPIAHNRLSGGHIPSQDGPGLDDSNEPGYCHLRNVGQPVLPEDLPQDTPTFRVVQAGMTSRFRAAVSLAGFEGERQFEPRAVRRGPIDPDAVIITSIVRIQVSREVLDESCRQLLLDRLASRALTAIRRVRFTQACPRHRHAPG